MRFRIRYSFRLLCALGLLITAIMLLSPKTRTFVKNFCYPSDRSALLSNSSVCRTNLYKNSIRTAKPRVYGYQVIFEPHICAYKMPYVVTFVHSAVSHFDKRQNIRNTLGSFSLTEYLSNVIIFVLGKTNNESHDNMIALESEKYQDILQLGFCDTYDNLTLKHVAWVEWLTTHCARTKFILKTDDDVFVDPFNLKSYLHQLDKTPERAIMCSPVARHDPIRVKSKWQGFTRRVSRRDVWSNVCRNGISYDSRSS